MYSQQLVVLSLNFLEFQILFFLLSFNHMCMRMVSPPVQPPGPADIVYSASKLCSRVGV